MNCCMRSASGGGCFPDKDIWKCSRTRRLVQSSFSVQPQPEVTARGHLRGNSTTVTTMAPAGINETAEVDEDVPATLALDVEMNSSLEYFGSQASEETLGGTIEEAGEETMATLGGTRCYSKAGKNSLLQQTFRSYQDCMNCCKRSA